MPLCARILEDRKREDAKARRSLTEYEYRYGGRLYNVDTPEADIFYEYNGAGQRVSRQLPGIYTTTNYYWNGWSGIWKDEGGRIKAE